MNLAKPMQPIIRLPILFIASAALCALWLLAVLVFVTDGVEGRTITVDDDGGAEYEKIQDAINASDDGDTIRVHDGDYKENLVIEKSVSLIGNGSAETSIDGDGSTVVYVSANHVNISGFTLMKGNTGIYIDSDHNRIFDNYCAENNQGISLRNSHYNHITNNSFFSHTYYSISLDSAEHNTIANNTCVETGSGISVYESHYNIFENNTITAMNSSDIRIYGSSHSVFKGNKMNGGGIRIIGNYSIDFWNTHWIDTSNSVKGRPVYYFTNDTGKTVPAGAGQIIISNCKDMTVKEQDISNLSMGLMIAYSSGITVENNSCMSNNMYGIYLVHSELCTIQRNSMGLNKRDGIMADHSGNNLIHGNIVQSNWKNGIFLGYGTNNQIVENIISDNGKDGIYIYESDGNIISQNQLKGNDNGIHLRGSSKDNVASMNNITRNKYHGVCAYENRGDTINAINNWWGDASGPCHSSKNPNGKGDKVSNYVKYDPWLRDPQSSPEEDDDDDFSLFGMNGYIVLGLAGVPFLIGLLIFAANVGKTSKGSERTPERFSESSEEEMGNHMK